MPLFQEHPVRSTGAFIVALGAGWFLTKLMSSLPIHLTQTSIAILAIFALLYIVTVHHRREGHVMTQTQEEMFLIGGFAMFWIAVLLAWRAYGGPSRHGGEQSNAAISGGSAGLFSDNDWSSDCSSDNVYCIVEEWSFW